jgi:hypothetical protein
MSSNSASQQTGGGSAQVTFGPGPPYLPYLVSLYHLVVLVGSGFLVANIYGFFSPGVAAVSAQVSLPLSKLALCSFCFGVMGGALCASRWVILSVGKKTYHKSKVLWQLMIPIHGGFLAIFMMVAIKSGMLSLSGTETPGEDTTKYAWLIMTVSFLSGFASRVVTERLEEMARALFGKKPKSNALSTK